MPSVLRLIVLTSCALSFAHAKFLPSPTLDFRTVVPPPPAAGSIAEAVDHQSAVLFTTSRTPEQTALALRYERIDVFTMLRPVVGEWATEQTLPRLASFLQEILPEVVPITDAAKEAYARPRPHETNPTLSLAYAKKPDGFSYPSGHGTASAMYAVILTALFPEHAADWEREAERVRLGRVYGGAHYLTDVIAGQRLGTAVGRELLKTAATQQALEEIRTEIARAQVTAQKAA